MIKKTIIFDDLDGNPVTKDFHFHLREDEVSEMEVSRHGGLSTYLEQMIKTEDNSAILSTVKEIVIKAIGERHEDNIQFIKGPEIWMPFMQSDAWSKLFMELFTDAEMMALFIKGVLPKKMGDVFEEHIANITDEKALEEYSEEELLEMSQSAFDELVGTDGSKMSKYHLIIAMKRRNAASKN